MNKVRLISLVFIFLLAGKSTLFAQSYTAFVGATLIDGSGATPIPNAVLLIQNGRVVAGGAKKDVSIPRNTVIRNVSGKTIIPGLINAHGHVGDVKGIQEGHYSTQNIIDNLSIYARYGVTTVVSLGGDRKDAEPVRHFNNPNAVVQRARLFIAGEVITGNTPEEALGVIENNHLMGVDLMKIRVDDQLGAVPKMPEAVYRFVISKSHELGYKIATHMYTLEDAKKLLAAGSDMLAHSVRDMPVDEDFIRLIKEKKAGYCPTLTRELSTFVYADTAAFFSDPFFRREYDSLTIKPLKDPARQLTVRNSRSAITYKRQLPVAMANLKVLSDRGVPVIFGTDSGMPTRFMGYFEHLEMKMMADAGLTPMQIIISATKNAAEYLGLKELGVLSPGHWADFIVLDANPLADITNTTKIAAVFIGGNEIPR